jgi:DnaA family protein
VRQLALEVRLRANAVFASFVPGDNAELVAALRDVKAGPLWIWGAPASGKTHLLQAACSAAGSGGAYFSLSAALSLPPESLLGFEASPVLCLDDLDAVAGNLAWERALFSLFNESAELHTRLLFAASAAPRSLAWSLEDWRSRAVASAVYQLHELDEAGRLAALERRAQQRGLHLPLETAEYLLKRVPRDLPSLFALLDALDGASLAARRRLTIPFIREALERT